MTPLAARFRRHLARAGCFPSPGTAVVAVSGGVDSLALLDLLHAEAPAYGLTLVVAHADHQIDPHSGGVAHAVAAVAARYGCAFELGELELGPGTSETVARAARYRWLRTVQAARHARYLVTAHQRDDQAETVLLRTLRGSGPAGLAGIPQRGPGGLVRPLLPFARADLAAHVAARGLSPHDDPANRDPRHVRSWIRHTLLPLVRERLPDASEQLVRVGRHAAADRRAWDGVLHELPDLEYRAEGRAFSVARAAFGQYDDAVAAAVIAAAARRIGCLIGPMRARQIRALAARPSGRRLDLPDGYTAEIAFDRLRVYKESPDPAPERVTAPGLEGELAFGGFVVRWGPGAAPAVLTRGGWTTWVGAAWGLRAYQAGDRLVPLGGVGHRLVRRLFMEGRVPRAARRGYPVVTQDDRVLWVPGLCRSAAGVPLPGTAAVRVDVTRVADGCARG